MQAKKIKTSKPILINSKNKAKNKNPKVSSAELAQIKDIVLKLLKLLDAEKIKIKMSQKQEDSLRIDIDCADPGILIGNRGETISSLQLILSLMVYKKLGHWQRILVNVGDYLDRRTEELEKLAQDAAQRVKFSGKEIIVPYLNSAERRIVHLILADNPDVLTESIGEGRDRRLMIKPKEKKSGK